MRGLCRIQSTTGVAEPPENFVKMQRDPTWILPPDGVAWTALRMRISARCRKASGSVQAAGTASSISLESRIPRRRILPGSHERIRRGARRHRETVSRCRVISSAPSRFAFGGSGSRVAPEGIDLTVRLRLGLTQSTQVGFQVSLTVDDGWLGRFTRQSSDLLTKG